MPRRKQKQKSEVQEESKVSILKIADIEPGVEAYEVESLSTEAQRNALTVKLRGRIRDFVYGKIRDTRAKFYGNVIFFRYLDKWICIGKKEDIEKII